MITISPIKKCEGSLHPPPDKSISHRALLVDSVASGTSEILNLSYAEDVQTTLKVLKNLGVKINTKKDSVFVEGGSLCEKNDCIIDCRNSGTTARVIMGFLAPENISARITGDDFLTHRPMERIISPLLSMGANINYLDRFGYLPISMKGHKLHGINYEMPVASAQVKSSLILAALKANGSSTIIEPVITRDHTERMLSMMEADIEVKRTDSGNEIHIGPSQLKALKMRIPGDFSSAAYYLALATLRAGKGLAINDVNLNPTRLGFLEILQEMGATVRIDMEDVMPEPVGRMCVQGGSLKAISVDPKKIPSMIDEVPLLAVIATQAKGKTVIRGAHELRIKESDRIGSLAEGLLKMGAQIEATEDGFVIEGPTPLKGAALHSHGDHRLAMCFATAAALAESESQLEGEHWISISYPDFFKDFQRLTQT
jgi:3-phosphoshikimate 1-carboxyvinyltransferase